MATTFEPRTNEPTHAHRWRIAEPDGPESPGFCVTCGATRVFRNWLPDDVLTSSTSMDGKAPLAA